MASWSSSCEMLIRDKHHQSSHFYAIILPQYVDNIVHHIVRNSQYCPYILKIFSTYCDNMVNPIMLTDIYVNRLVEVDNKVNNSISIENVNLTFGRRHDTTVT